ncbi:hypothetical protein NDU88_002644 [Pleurodeles waltl]|uniref:Uncharacterized protein n=1 Tax=Pleurodeles waltl TaxID=8319 RepID=A0AAV7NEL5_PLEWA|nr:hypothetical protein NDU88_002644 [Pleurodeles waltl]
MPGVDISDSDACCLDLGIWRCILALSRGPTLFPGRHLMSDMPCVQYCVSQRRRTRCQGDRVTKVRGVLCAVKAVGVSRQCFSVP